MKKDEEIRSKEQLETELLKVRSEIQWREREIEEATKDAPRYYFIAFISLLLLFPIVYLFEEVEVIGFVIWIIITIILAKVVIKSFEKTKEGKKLQKAKRELEELRRRKAELERKLDNLEPLKEVKKDIKRKTKKEKG